MKNIKKKQIKVLIFAKHLDGGTGTFTEQLTAIQKFSMGQMTLKIAALEKPQYRTFHSKVLLKYFSENLPQSYYYLLTPSTTIYFIRELLWFNKEIKIFNPDVVLSIDNHCNVIACLNKIFYFRKNRYKIIATIHNNISAVTFAKIPRSLRIVFRVMCRLLFAQASHIVGVSLGVARDTKDFFLLKQTPIVIRYGVNIQKIRRLAKKTISTTGFAFSKRNMNILSIGRFAPQKDFITLIDGFAQFHVTTPNAHLYLIGDGQDRGAVLDFIHDKHMDNYIHVLGWKQNVYSYVKAANIFILSSKYEGFPFVLLEAGALGKPIIATHTPYGPRELLGNNKYGILVPMKNSSAIAEAFSRLQNKEIYHYYEAQIGKRIEKFTEKAMVQNYYSLVSSLMKT